MEGTHSECIYKGCIYRELTVFVKQILKVILHRVKGKVKKDIFYIKIVKANNREKNM